MRSVFHVIYVPCTLSIVPTFFPVSSINPIHKPDVCLPKKVERQGPKVLEPLRLNRFSLPRVRIKTAR